jgi:hypothetical protein
VALLREIVEEQLSDFGGRHAVNLGGKTKKLQPATAGASFDFPMSGIRRVC